MRSIAARIAPVLTGTATALANPEEVEIAGAQGTLLRAVVYRPAGPGPFRAVVALHGCGGLAGPSGPIAQRYGDWGERLAEAGFVVVFPDSYGSRGLGSQCGIRDRLARIARERAS